LPATKIQRVTGFKRLTNGYALLPHCIPLRLAKSSGQSRYRGHQNRRGTTGSGWASGGRGRQLTRCGRSRQVISALRPHTATSFQSFKKTGGRAMRTLRPSPTQRLATVRNSLAASESGRSFCARINTVATWGGSSRTNIELSATAQAARQAERLKTAESVSSM